MIIQSDLNIKQAHEQYAKVDSIQGNTYRFDPFSLPDYYHPTYEVSNDKTLFNPKLKIAGYSCKEFDCLNDLYELMPYDDYQRNISLAYSSLRFRNIQKNIPDKVLNFQVEACFKLKGKHGKWYYYKRTSNENGMVNGLISSAVSYWEDIGYLNPKDRFHWRVTGKNTNFFDFEVPEIEYYQDIFSPQQAKILSLLARGFSSADIGRALKISRHTVDTHRRNMLRKLEAANTVELVELARDMNII